MVYSTRPDKSKISCRADVEGLEISRGGDRLRRRIGPYWGNRSALWRGR